MAVQFSYSVERWPLRDPFFISGHSWTHLEAVIASISDGECTGKGEAAGIFFLGETTDTISEQLEDARSDIEAGITRQELLEILPPGGARNAIDCALWDLEAKQGSTNVADLIGIATTPLATAVTISIKSTADEMARLARENSAYGLLKVKLDQTDPVSRMEAIRAARPDATLIIDANQGFDIETLNEVLPAFERLDIAMVEQPLPRGKDEALESVRSKIPLCADESLLDSSDLDAASKRYQMINIKLDKTGGLTEALALQSAAHKRGLATMVGNMFGTSLAMAPAFLIGQNCRFCDLDGPFHLVSDRTPSMKLKDGIISLPDAPGWGGLKG